MQEDERRSLGKKMRVCRARLARKDDDSVIQSTAHSKIVGGKCAHTECVMDRGCTFPIISTAVAKALGVERKYGSDVSHKLGLRNTANCER